MDKPFSCSARRMAAAAVYPMGPRVMTARSFPSFSLRPVPTVISLSGQRQSVSVPRPRG